MKKMKHSSSIGATIYSSMRGTGREYICHISFAFTVLGELKRCYPVCYLLSIILSSYSHMYAALNLVRGRFQVECSVGTTSTFLSHGSYLA